MLILTFDQGIDMSLNLNMGLFQHENMTSLKTCNHRSNINQPCDSPSRTNLIH